MDPITIFFAFFGGILSVFNPCSIVIIPSFVAFTTSNSIGVKKGLVLSISYGLGFILFFSLIGAALLFIPGFLVKQLWAQLVGGVIMMLIGIYILFPFFKLKNFHKKREKENNIQVIQEIKVDRIELPSNTEWTSNSSAFILGISHGTFGLGCTGPLLASVITVIVNGTLIEGWFALLMYGIGMIIPFLLLGMFLGKINELFVAKLIQASKILKIIYGLIILILGLYNLLNSLLILGIF